MESEDLILSFKGNHSLKFLGNLFEKQLQWGKSLILDLADVEFATPVICVFYKFFAYYNYQIRLPYSPQVKSYLEWMSKCNSPDSTRYIPTWHGIQPKDASTIQNYLRNILSDQLQEEALSDLVDYALSELMDNVFDHSQSEIGFFIQAQKYPSKERVEIFLLDRGRGIATSLKDNPVYSSFDDKKRFELALSPRITAKPEKHSGEGLSSVITWVEKNSSNYAQGVIFSNSDVWFCVNGKTGLDHTNYTIWPGTLIWLSIPYNPPINLNKIWSDLKFDVQ